MTIDEPINKGKKRITSESMVDSGVFNVNQPGYKDNPIVMPHIKQSQYEAVLLEFAKQKKLRLYRPEA